MKNGFGLALLLSALPVSAQGPPRVSRTVDVSKEIVIVVNDDAADSITVGNYYAQKRGIPASQICHLRTGAIDTAVPATEACSRPDLRAKILAPLRTFLSTRPQVLYIVTTYGIPFKTWPEFSTDMFLTDMAAVDREIEVINVPHDDLGAWPSAVYLQDRHITTADHIYIVSRLDGPSAADAMALVDNALDGEAHGVSGVNFLDNGGHPDRSDFIRCDYDLALNAIIDVWERYGLPWEHEATPATTDLCPRRDQAHYWNFYNAAVMEVTDPAFRFNPGAVAVRTTSMPAMYLRWMGENWWVPWAIRSGVTGTAGCGEEPFLGSQMRGDIFMDRFMQGYTMGEAMEMANPFASWHMNFIGDPLYAPYAANVMANQTPRGSDPGAGGGRSGGGGGSGAGCEAGPAGASGGWALMMGVCMAIVAPLRRSAHAALREDRG